MSKKKTILIFAGAPRAGKDTFLTFLQTCAVDYDLTIRHVSAIDPVKSLLMEAGVDISKKTDADRLLMAEVKASLEKHSLHLTKLMINHARSAFAIGEADVFITQIREVVGIQNLKNYARKMNMDDVLIDVVIVRNEAAEISCPNNFADQEWKNIRPDIVIDNNTTLDHLIKQADDLAKRLANNEP